MLISLNVRTTSRVLSHDLRAWARIVIEGKDIINMLLTLYLIISQLGAHGVLSLQNVVGLVDLF